MEIWIVIAGAPAALLLKRVLSDPGVHVEDTWEFSSAMMRAGRIAGHDEHPVILVMDTDSLEKRPIEEYRLEIGGYLRRRSGGTPSRLVLAIPQVETVLFHDRAGLERALGRRLSYDEAFEARFRPRAVFERLVGEEDTEAKALAVIDRLDDAALRCMATHPLIREIREFVDEMARREELEEAEEIDEEELEPLRRAG